MGSKYKIFAVVLAGGSSTRYGENKLMLDWHGNSMIDHCVNKLSEMNLEEIVVVTGKYHHEIKNELKNSRANIIYNIQHENGISSSIIKGVEYVSEKCDDNASILIVLPDQPYVSIDHLNQLINIHLECNNAICATIYNSGKKGVPAIFPAKDFSKLLELEGDVGAKKILNGETSVITVDSKINLVDIDNEIEYLLNKYELN